MYKKLLFGFIACGLLTIVVASCTITGTNTSALPAVHMGAADFIQHSVTIHKGDMLNLIDDAPSPHLIMNGRWVNGVQKPAKEPGAPTVNHMYVGNDSAPIGPFTTAGTFYLYCTTHLNMNLTVIVQ